MKCLLIVFASVALLGVGCQKVGQLVPVPQPVAINTDVTYFVSTEDALKYCNGDAMDTEGYRKTLTKEQSINLPTSQSSAERVKAVLVAATTGMCQQVIQQADITVANGIVSIPPIDGWAGISIAMCSCRPQVEVNALRIPGIQKVIWDATAPAVSGPTLDLSNRGLTAIPSSVFSKTNLEYLNLSSNLLTGAPQAEIRLLQNLKSLNLSGNRLTGLPAELGQLKKLETLNVSNNQLTGLPLELGNLTQLRVFDVSGNLYSQQDLDQIAAKLPTTEIRR